MATLSRKATFLVQLVKEAGKIETETKLAKMLCYIEKERGVGTGFSFDRGHKHGNYTFEIKEEIANLVKEGLITFDKEKVTSIWGEPFERHIFTATDKLKKTTLPLSEKEKRAIHSVYREYSRYSRKEIEDYDHEVYREGRIRADAELRVEATKKTNKLIEKHKGNEKAAFEEWLSQHSIGSGQ